MAPSVSEVSSVEATKVTTGQASKIALPASQASAGHEEAAITIGDKYGKIPVPGIPLIKDVYEQRIWAKQHMAAAFRLFAKYDYGLGVSGHISLRDPVDPGLIWFNPFAVHFSTIKASDLVLVDEEGHVVEGGNQAAVNAAGFYIHSALHKARPDVNAACHAHSPHGVAYSVFGKPLEMITQDVCYFYNRHSVYDNFGGIVLAAEEGRRIAAALGPNNHSVILQNHGLLTTGKTVDEAAYLFHHMERACGVQLAANAAGLPKKYIAVMLRSPSDCNKANARQDEEAEFTAQSGNDRDSLYLDFMTEYNAIEHATKGDFLL